MTTSFEESLLPHMKAAFSLAYWIVRNREEAEDVVQDAYLRAFRAYARFDGAAVKPWLLTIVRNVAYRAVHNRKRDGSVLLFSEDLRTRENLDAREIASHERSAESRLVAEGERLQLLAALEALPDYYREVVVLRELEELSYSTIAQTVDAPVGTVMSCRVAARLSARPWPRPMQGTRRMQCEVTR